MSPSKRLVHTHCLPPKTSLPMSVSKGSETGDTGGTRRVGAGPEGRGGHLDRRGPEWTVGPSTNEVSEGLPVNGRGPTKECPPPLRRVSSRVKRLLFLCRGRGPTTAEGRRGLRPGSPEHGRGGGRVRGNIPPGPLGTQRWTGAGYPVVTAKGTSPDPHTCVHPSSRPGHRSRVGVPKGPKDPRPDGDSRPESSPRTYHQSVSTSPQSLRRTPHLLTRTPRSRLTA